MNGTKAAALTFLIFWPVSASAQAMIENPAKPAARDAGRVLKLTEVWRIADDGGTFFFAYPRDLKFADDGSIFLRESGQFLKFSPDGKFIKDIYKKGQGPGEWSGKGAGYSYGVRGRDLFIFEDATGRFWRADLDGRFQGMIELPNLRKSGRTIADLIGVLPAGFLFKTYSVPLPSQGAGLSVDVPHTIALAGQGAREARPVATIQGKAFAAPHSVLFDLLIVKLDPGQKVLYVLNGWDYMIEAVDTGSGAVVKRFTRAYPKVRLVLTDAQEEDRRQSGLPKYEYRPDIENLYPVGDRLWVETSTDDKAKGRLFDVFDQDGRYADSFYLGAGKALMAAREGFVFCQEKGEDESIRIVKYRIEK